MRGLQPGSRQRLCEKRDFNVPWHVKDKESHPLMAGWAQSECSLWRALSERCCLPRERRESSLHSFRICDLPVQTGSQCTPTHLDPLFSQCYDVSCWNLANTDSDTLLEWSKEIKYMKFCVVFWSLLYVVFWSWPHSFSLRATDDWTLLDMWHNVLLFYFFCIKQFN